MTTEDTTETTPTTDTPLGWKIRSRNDSDRSESKRTEGAAWAAFAFAIAGLFIAPLGVIGLIATHWAVKGARRTTALVTGWLAIIGLAIVAIVLIAGMATVHSATNQPSTGPNSTTPTPTPTSTMVSRQGSVVWTTVGLEAEINHESGYHDASCTAASVDPTQGTGNYVCSYTSSDGRPNPNEHVVAYGNGEIVAGAW